jgi:hypothetical protein
VLLWEILSFAREQPLEPLSDDDVLNLLMDYPSHSATCNADQVPTLTASIGVHMHIRQHFERSIKTLLPFM